ncbi:MAG: Gfo/Idh/MocA family oxidoreductase [Pirellulales bacterium]|nr:Gfo/Idh/MocA family oxidoreductase [Pirellulales bacterium]
MKRESLDRRSFLGTLGGTALVGPALVSPVLAATEKKNEAKPTRIAFIGVGSRGTGLLKQILRIDGVEVPAICDINTAHLNTALGIVKERRGNTPAGFSKGPYDYRRMLERNDYDAILLGTPPNWHTVMATDAMKAGKHVASEVPGAYTIDECWNLVRTKEKTGKHYMLLENYIFPRDNMMAGNMIRQGLFGDLYYAECSYAHDCRSIRFTKDGKLTWRGEVKKTSYGNTYPTHAIGPVAKWLGINRGDRFVSLVSQMSRPGAALRDYTARRFGPDSPAAKVNYIAGDMCLTTLTTAKGCLITVHYDTDSPRPASGFHMVQGTRGCYNSRQGVYLDGKSPTHRWEPMSKYREKYDDPAWKQFGKLAQTSGHGGGDYLTLLEFVNSLREDREPMVDVYDSAAWSCIVELSKQSIDGGGVPVEVPDFTNGKWETRTT